MQQHMQKLNRAVLAHQLAGTRMLGGQDVANWLLNTATVKNYII